MSTVAASIDAVSRSGAGDKQDATATTGHRADIDGLRALAVLPILFFHLGVSGFEGGFVGVDIFFVISGFLIGGVTLRELEEGGFSLARFYQRRLRRILPALLVMLLVTGIASAFVLLPQDLRDLGESALATALFGANIYFWTTTDYFGAAGTSAPLLHAWSLGVEEQYYLLFPLVALILSRGGRRFVWPAIAALALMSFLVSVKLTYTHPQANFFLLPSRAWELLGGVLVAITPLPFLRYRMLREAAAAVGIALVVWAVLSYNEYTPFPGWRALAPCLGTALIIAAGGQGTQLTGRILATPPLRFIGLISYSLYLWHWPVIVLLLQWLPATRLDLSGQILAGSASLILAILSWRWIETPFRRSTASPRLVIGMSMLAVGVLCALAASLVVTGGLPGRFDRDTNRIAAALDYPQAEVLRAHRCFLIEASDRYDLPHCLSGRPDAPDILLLGDSHAAHLWPGLSAVYRGSDILQMTASGCRPLARQDGYISGQCRRLMRWAFDDYLTSHRPELVILAGRWKSADLPGLEATLAILRRRGIDVLVAGPAPAWQLPVPRLLALGRERGVPDLPAQFFEDDLIGLDREIAMIARSGGATYVSLLRASCRPLCDLIGTNGDPLVVDDSHISAEGSVRTARAFAHPQLVRIPRPGADNQREGPGR